MEACLQVSDAVYSGGEARPNAMRSGWAALDITTFAFFVIATLAIWTQVSPFIDLQDPTALDDTTASNVIRKFVTIGLVIIGVGLVHARRRLGGLTSTVDLPLILVIGWFGVCSVLSPVSGLALNRLALAISVIAIAACIPLMMRSIGDFITAMGVTVSIVIALCFLGVLLVPELSIHTARDANEQALAGDWRGVFSHKNELAAVSNLFVFTGILVWRTKSWLWGGAIIALSAVLMLMSGGKTAVLLVVPVLGVTFLLMRARQPWVGFVLALGLIGSLVLATIGSVAFPQVQAVTEAVMPDATFTGRTEIWDLAMTAVENEPLTGHGYSVFWDTDLPYQTADSRSPAALAAHAHNGYLETALSGGIPGLILVLIWVGFLPWKHIEILKRRIETSVERAFAEFLAQTWLFGLLISCLEAVMFNRGNASWFSVAVAITCLRQWVVSRAVTN